MSAGAQVEQPHIDLRELKLAAMPRTTRGHQIKTFAFETKVVNEAEGIIEGYASVFDVFDSYNDVVRPGAFTRTIKEKHTGRTQSKFKFLWQHDWSSPLGLPIHIEEDSTGLRVVTKVVDPTDLGRRALIMAKEGVVNGLSIGFDLFSGGANWLEMSDLTPEQIGQLDLEMLGWWPPRELTLIDLWEFSQVTFGANPDALIDAVKSIAQTIYPGWTPPAMKTIPTETRARAGDGADAYNKGAIANELALERIIAEAAAQIIEETSSRILAAMADQATTAEPQPVQTDAPPGGNPGGDDESLANELAAALAAW